MTTVTDLILDYTGQDLPSFISTLEKYNSILTDLYDTYFSRVRDSYATTFNELPDDSDSDSGDSMMTGSDTVKSILDQFKFSRESLRDLDEMSGNYVQGMTNHDRTEFRRDSRFGILTIVDELSEEIKTLSDEYQDSDGTKYTLIQDILDGNYDAILFGALQPPELLKDHSLYDDLMEHEDYVPSIDEIIELLTESTEQDDESMTEEVDQILEAYIESIDKWMSQIETYRRAHGYPMLANIGSYEN